MICNNMKSTTDYIPFESRLRGIFKIWSMFNGKGSFPFEIDPFHTSN